MQKGGCFTLQNIQSNIRETKVVPKLRQYFIFLNVNSEAKNITHRRQRNDLQTLVLEKEILLQEQQHLKKKFTKKLILQVIVLQNLNSMPFLMSSKAYRDMAENKRAKKTGANTEPCLVPFETSSSLGS